MLSVSGRMSTKTGRAPSLATALAVETNVNDGRIASSPGPRAAEDRGHLERGRAGRSQQDMGNAESFLEQPAARLGEMAVPADVSIGHGLSDVEELFAGDEGLVERDRAGGVAATTKHALDERILSVHGIRPAMLRRARRQSLGSGVRLEGFRSRSAPSSEEAHCGLPRLIAPITQGCAILERRPRLVKPRPRS